MTDRLAFLDTRIAALKDQIQRGKDMLELYTLMPDVDAARQTAELHEIRRRIDVDERSLKQREDERLTLLR